MDDDSETGTAQYVFRVAFRLEPSVEGVTTDPDQFRTTLFRKADPPGEPGWLFFRDNLWHGELADERHFRRLTEDALGVPVTSVTFSELQTDEAYLDALYAEAAADLEAFNADDADEAVSKYLGSSIRVTDESG